MQLHLYHYIRLKVSKRNKEIDKVKNEVNKVKQKIKKVESSILNDYQDHSKRYIDELIKLQKLVVKARLTINRLPQTIESNEQSTRVVLHSKVKFSGTDEILPLKVRFEKSIDNHSNAI